MMQQRELQSNDCRYILLPSEVQEKLDFSRKQSETLEMRDVKCPVCGFKVLEVFGHEHQIMRVKCRKCKFNDIMDIALFRTMKVRSKNELKSWQNKKKKPLR